MRRRLIDRSFPGALSGEGAIAREGRNARFAIENMGSIQDWLA